jgi:hypothetical protein
MPDTCEQLRGHTVADCPHCGECHEYAVAVQVGTATLVFGGAGHAVEVGFHCPKLGGLFTSQILLANNEQFVRVVSGGSAETGTAAGPGGVPGTSGGAATQTTAVPQAPGSSSAPSRPPEAADFAEWVKASRATALDFAKTMLTASSSAIPVYFAVLKYLGSEKLADSAAGRLSVLPPVLFLLAVAIFAAGLRPRLAAVTPDDFVQFRADRMRQLDRFVSAGLLAFVVALLLASIIFGLALLA